MADIYIYLDIAGASSSAGKGWNGFGNTSRILEHMDDRGKMTLVSFGAPEEEGHHGEKQRMG